MGAIHCNRLIEAVCITLKEPEQRHYKALDSFYSYFPQAEEAIFINSDNAEDFLEN